MTKLALVRHPVVPGLQDAVERGVRGRLARCPGRVCDVCPRAHPHKGALHVRAGRPRALSQAHVPH